MLLVQLLETADWAVEAVEAHTLLAVLVAVAAFYFIIRS
jgi:hypothetical protein